MGNCGKMDVFDRTEPDYSGLFVVQSSTGVVLCSTE